MPTAQPHDDRIRRPVPLVALLLAVVVLLGGTAAGLTLITRDQVLPVPAAARDGGGHSSRPVAPRLVSAAEWRSCTPPRLGTTPGAPPARIGTWAYRVLATGTFTDAVPDLRGGLYLLQACGAEESSLRVVHVEHDGGVVAVSRMFRRAALLTSGLTATTSGVFFATARLDLAGDATLPPYQLAIARLDPQSLAVTARASLGRGRGADLAVIGASQPAGSGPADSGPADSGPAGVVLAATGSRLLGIVSSPSGQLEVRQLLTFGPAISEHLAVDRGTSSAVVSVLVPGATGPGASTRLEVIELRVTRGTPSARLLRMRKLAPGMAVQSLVATAGRVFWSGGNEAATSVEAARLPRLGPILTKAESGTGTGSRAGASATTGTGMQMGTTTLQPVSLGASGDTVFVLAATSVECMSATTGRVLAATASRGSPPPAPAEIVRSGSATFAITAWGLGRLATPPACAGTAGD